MSGERLLLDTVFVQGLISRRDQHHRLVLSFVERMETASEVWITESIMLEVANALSGIDRQGAVDFIRGCYQTPNMRIVAVDSALLMRALDLYEARLDKGWSLTDCISFLVMQDNRLTSALTTDIHFRQAGFTPLLAQE